MNAPVSPTGLLVVDKPVGPTSMDVCRVVRRALVAAGAPKRVKVGHGGTLDPRASGVLVVLIGKATRLCEQVMVGQKTYLTDVDLSVTSTTDDTEGVRTPIPPATPVPDLPSLEAACARHTGTIMQRPPIYSAIKVQGRRAYDLARRGEADDLVLPARPVEVQSIRIEEYRWPTLRLVVDCGKGVYIRSLARDLGASLGVGGMLTSLRRTRVGVWTIEQATAMNHLPPHLTQSDLIAI